jgi:DNA-binding CsgD family transcriptional regulator
MDSVDWHDSEQALAAIAALLASPFERAQQTLSDTLQSIVPHEAMAILTGSCARSPMAVVGDDRVADRITSADLARLAGSVAVGDPFYGHAAVAGEDRAVLVAAAGPVDHGSLLLLVRADDTPIACGDALLVQHVWDLFALQLANRVEEADPGELTLSRAAASERTRVTAELADVHAATLAGLLGTLRNRDLDDRAARSAATDLAAAALVELRATAEAESELTAEPATRAFTALKEELAPLARYGSAEIEFAGPDEEATAGLTLPSVVAQAARAIVRRVVLTMLEQGDLHRVRVAWELGDDLVVTVRDDGHGDLAAGGLPLQAIVDRAQALGGTVEVESVPGWGTRMLARLPLQSASAGERLPASPLEGLAPRELDVLAELAQGKRNRQIAESLQISENTVKFHVANVLGKLGVHSRGEAAAVAREAGLPGVALQAVS